MAFNTKINLIDAKVYQNSGQTLTLSGNTFIAASGRLKYSTDQHNTYTSLSVPDVAYVTGCTAAMGNAITGATNGLSVSGKNIGLGGQLTGNTIINLSNKTLTITGGTNAITFLQLSNNYAALYSANVGVDINPTTDTVGLYTTGGTSFDVNGGTDTINLCANNGAYLCVDGTADVISAYNFCGAGVWLNSSNVEVSSAGGACVIVKDTGVTICTNIVRIAGNIGAGSTSDAILVWNSGDKQIKTISISGITGGTSSSTITGATNLGSGNGEIYTSVSDNKLQLKTLSGGTNVTITCDGNYIAINAADIGIIWSGSTSNGIGTYIDANKICSQPNLTFDGTRLGITGNVCASTCVTSPILSGTTCVTSPITIGTTCVVGAITCGTTCVRSPLVSGGTIYAITCVCSAKFCTTGQMKSTLVTGSSPFSVDSTTVNANLNADLLDGYHANQFTLSTAYCVSSYSAVTTGVTLSTGSSYVILAAFASALSIKLPSTPLDGQTFKIKDICGCALNKNILICGNGKNIDGSATALINTDYGALELIYSSTPVDGWYSLAFIN
jgi:hypothetical protein